MSSRQKKLERRKREAAARQRRRSHVATAAPHLAPAGRSHLEVGVAYLQQGDLRNARSCFEQAVAHFPRDAVAHNCLGIVDRLQGKLEPARRRFEQALRLRPDFAEAFNNLGNCYRDQEQSHEAELAYRRAIRMKPAFPEALNNLGVILLSREAHQEAIDSFEGALRLHPHYVEALNNLGNAHRARNDLEQARARFTEALRLSPDSAEVHNNLGNVFRDLGELLAARTHYEAAIRSDPTLLDAYANLGSVQTDRGELAAAIDTYRRVLERHPQAVDSWLQLGNVCRLQGDAEQARDAYRQAHRLCPGDPLLELRISATCPIIFPTAAAAEDYRQQSLFDWRRLARAAWGSSTDESTLRLVEPPFELQFLPGNLRPHREAFAQIYEGRFPQWPLPPRPARPTIGLLVTRAHEGIFIKSMRGMIAGFDPDVARLVIVCPPASIEPLRSALRCDIEFLALPRAFQTACECLRDAAFDVLYFWEVGTDSTNYFLPFLRLAPVQCTGWGYQTTSGIRNVDHYLSSDLIEVPEADQHYSEQLIRANTILTYQERIIPVQRRRRREDFGIPPHAHIYLCAHQLGKFHPDFDFRLSGILRKDSRGIAVILEDRHAVASQQLQARFESVMPDVVHQIRFLPRQDRAGYLDLVAVADVVLDPPHFTGANTTYDALALGKPVITLPTAYRRGRFSAGCYRMIGYDELVVTTQEDYVNLAVELARNAAWREHLEIELQRASDVLFEDSQAVREFARIMAELVDLARA